MSLESVLLAIIIFSEVIENRVVRDRIRVLLTKVLSIFTIEVDCMDF